MPSVAFQRACCKVVNDQVFVPSCSAVGCRRASCDTRSRSAAVYFAFGPPMFGLEIVKEPKDICVGHILVVSQSYTILQIRLQDNLVKLLIFTCP